MTPTKTKTLSRTHNSRNKPPTSREGWKLQTSANGVGFLQVPALSAFPWLIHGFSTSQGGVSSFNGRKVLNLGFTEWDTRENVQENRKLFQSALDADRLAFVSVKQFHSDVVCDFSSAPNEPCSADASISKTPNLLLGIQTADCVPILLLDPKKRAVAAVVSIQVADRRLVGDAGAGESSHFGAHRPIRHAGREGIHRGRRARVPPASLFGRPSRTCRAIMASHWPPSG